MIDKERATKPIRRAGRWRLRAGPRPGRDRRRRRVASRRKPSVL